MPFLKCTPNMCYTVSPIKFQHNFYISDMIVLGNLPPDLCKILLFWYVFLKQFISMQT